MSEEMAPAGGSTEGVTESAPAPESQAGGPVDHGGPSAEQDVSHAAGASSGDTEPAQVRIPKDRFDEVNGRRKAAETERDELRQRLAAYEQQMQELANRPADLQSMLQAEAQRLHASQQQETEWSDPLEAKVGELTKTTQQIQQQYYRDMFQRKVDAAQEKYPHADIRDIQAGLARSKNPLGEDIGALAKASHESFVKRAKEWSTQQAEVERKQQAALLKSGGAPGLKFDKPPANARDAGERLKQSLSAMRRAGVM